MYHKWVILLFLLPVPALAATDLGGLEIFAGRLVSDITISGNNVTEVYVIRREIHTQVGDTLSIAGVEGDIGRLENLGIFAEIQVVATGYSNGVGLEYQVREMPWIVPYVAFRYTEENGWAVGPAASSVNLFGRDILLSARALFGGVNTFEVSLNWPWITGNHFGFDLQAAKLNREQVILDFEEDSYEVTPWVGTWWRQNGRVAGMVGWFQMNADSSGRTLSPDNQDNLMRVGGRLGWDSRDSWRNPHRGWKNELQVIRTGGPLPGDGDFWTCDIDLQRYQPLTARQTLLLGWLTVLQTGQVNVDLPSYLQYFMGGSNSIRGYDFDVLGGELFGKNEMIVTAEYQYLVTDLRPIRLWKWAIAAGLEVAAFTDLGIAWDTDPALELNDNFSWDRFKVGGGIGLRFLVPSVDVVRMDMAIGEDGSFRFHFAVWPKLYAQRLRIR
jgi:outer membrane protein insertion porin family